MVTKVLDTSQYKINMRQKKYECSINTDFPISNTDLLGTWYRKDGAIHILSHILLYAL